MAVLRMHEFDCGVKRLAGRGSQHFGDQFRRDALRLWRGTATKVKGLSVREGGNEQ